MKTYKKKKCKDCGYAILIVGEHPRLEWCDKCAEYKNKAQWEKEFGESFPEPKKVV